MKITINYIFCGGHRCNSVDFLKTRGLRMISGPFDYTFIDIESTFKIINNKFEDYLCDLVIFNKNQQTLINKKNTNCINESFYGLKDVNYMGERYNDNTLLFNQNYVSGVTSNLYDFDRILEFHHHPVDNENVKIKMESRVLRFKNIISSNDPVALFYITKIISDENVYMDYVLNNKKKYNIHTYLIIIINCNRIGRFFINGCLFILKKVKSYDLQFLEKNADNNLNYSDEYEIIKEYFDFQLK